MKYIQLAVYQLVVMILISLFSPLTHAQSSHSFNHIVFFGDSLTDNGNFYSATLGFMPKSPPYYKGHFSNGKVWSDYVTSYYQALNISVDNYAVGGETAVLHNPIGGYLPFTIGASIDDYLLRTFYGDRTTTLYIIWIGGNDYLPGYTDANALTNNVITNIQAGIESLIYHGGTHFIVINLPDLSDAPYAKENDLVNDLASIVPLHNAKLQDMVNTLKANYKNDTFDLFDVNKLMADVIAKHTFKDATTACWQGGYVSKERARLDKNVSLDEAFNAYLHTNQTLMANTTMKPLSKSELANLSDFAQHSPALMESFRVERLAAEGIVPCSNPNEHIFWDRVHPSAAVHRLLAADAINFINSTELAK